MSGAVLKSVRVDFHQEGLEVSVGYTHADPIPNPGTKTRTTTAARMAAAGLQRALEALGTGPGQWGGFATDTRTSTDRLLFENKLTSESKNSEEGAA